MAGAVDTLLTKPIHFASRLSRGKAPTCCVRWLLSVAVLIIGALNAPIGAALLVSVHGVTGLIFVILHGGMAGEPRSTLSLPLPVPTGAYHMFAAAFRCFG